MFLEELFDLFDVFMFIIEFSSSFADLAEIVLLSILIHSFPLAIIALVKFFREMVNDGWELDWLLLLFGLDFYLLLFIGCDWYDREIIDLWAISWRTSLNFDGSFAFALIGSKEFLKVLNDATFTVVL